MALRAAMDRILSLPDLAGLSSRSRQIKRSRDINHSEETSVKVHCSPIQRFILIVHPRNEEYPYRKVKRTRRVKTIQSTLHTTSIFPSNRRTYRLHPITTIRTLSIAPSALALSPSNPSRSRHSLATYSTMTTHGRRQAFCSGLKTI